MCRYLALSCLLLCTAVWSAQAGSAWDRNEDSMDKKSEIIKAVLKAAVEHGKLTKEEAKELYKEITSMGKDGSWGEDSDEDGWATTPTSKKDSGESDEDSWGTTKMDSEEHEWGDKSMAKKQEYMTAMKHVKKLFKQAKSSGKDLTDKLHKVLYYYKNGEDPLIDLDHENELHVSAHFVAEEMHTEICDVVYTIPAVDMKTEFDGDIVGAAQVRGAPEVHITDKHGDKLHDGLYTMIGSLRGGDAPAMGDFTHPMISFMFVNIHGSDLDTGDVVVPYIGLPYDRLNQIFLYKQHDYIFHDFAIADYTRWDECKFQFRCRFEQEEFVKRYDLDLKWVGTIHVVPDPYTIHFMRFGADMMNKRDACEFFLLAVIPEAFKLYHVDVHNEDELDKAAKQYALAYVPLEQFKENATMNGMTKQLHAIGKRYLTDQPYDSLVSFMDDIHLNLAFRFRAPATKVHLCGQKFGLKAVDKQVHFKHAWEGETVELLASEIREEPDLRITKDHKQIRSDKFYTLMVVDRSEDNYYLGEYIKEVSTNYQPFINWMVVNMKGCDVKSGYHLKPYMPYPESKEQFVFLFEQHGPLDYDFPISKYTVGDKRSICWPQDRCRVKQIEMAYDYGLKLVGVARYNIKPDIYGATFLSRWGRTTPDMDCNLYLKKDYKLPEKEEEK